MNILRKPKPSLKKQPHKHRELCPFPWATPRLRKPAFAFQPPISVVLPVYNQAHLLPKSIESVLTQRDCEFELIIVNDGSTDEIHQALAAFEADSRIQIIHQQNRGLSEALNAGFARARGEFLTWTSADNRYLPGALSKLSHFLLANPSLGLSYANVRLIDQHGSPLKGSNYRPADQSPEDSSLLLLPTETESLYEYNDNFINACFMYRRAVRDRVGNYVSEYNGFEDYDYWLRAGLSALIAHIDTDEPLYQYRLHAESATETLNLDAVRQGARAIVSRRKLEREAVSSEGPLAVHSLLADKTVVDGYLYELLGSTAASSPTIHAFRPGNFPQKLNYTHAGHRTLHGAHTFAPFVVSTESPPTGNQAQACSSVVFPPLRIPALLKRARASDFGAVTPSVPANDETRANLLVFMPGDNDFLKESAAWRISTLISIIVGAPQITFVLLATTPEERAAADSINLALENNRNLRIIDLSGELKESASNAGSGDRYMQSLMYTLNGVDGILSVKTPGLSAESLLELRVELALGAYAGRGVIAVVDDATTVEASIHAFVTTAPHLLAIKNPQKIQPGKLTNSVNISQATIQSTLIEAINWTNDWLSINSLEQWIVQEQPEAIAREIRATALAKSEQRV